MEGGYITMNKEDIRKLVGEIFTFYIANNYNKSKRELILSFNLPALDSFLGKIE
jgi:hypothetical protein